MANVPVLSGAGATVYLKSSGAGSDADPFIPQHAATLLAGVANIGDADILSLVGDSVDLDSDAGVDDHAGVAWLLPGAGGHVVGGTEANPIRVDPVGSTVQKVSVASWFTGAGVVATVVGNPTVIASLAGVGAVAISSWFTGADVVATIVGNPIVRAYQAPQSGMLFTSVPVALSGSGLTLIGSSAKPLALIGYQIIAAGTINFGIYDGSFNNAIVGSMQLWPVTGIALPPNPWAPVGMTASGRAIVIGIDSSCRISGAIQYYEG